MRPPRTGCTESGGDRPFSLSVLTELEPPNVVAQIQPRYESRFAQLHQIAVDRGAVEVERLKGSRNFGVTERTCGTLQFSQDREARGGAAETKSLNARAQCLALGAPLRGFHETAFCQTAKSPRASARCAVAARGEPFEWLVVAQFNKGAFGLAPECGLVLERAAEGRRKFLEFRETCLRISLTTRFGLSIIAT